MKTKEIKKGFSKTMGDKAPRSKLLAQTGLSKSTNVNDAKIAPKDNARKSEMIEGSK